MINDQPIAVTKTMRQWLAERLMRGQPPAPTLSDLIEVELWQTQVALLTAEADEERASHTVAMLQARVDRLTLRHATENPS